MSLSENLHNTELWTRITSGNQAAIIELLKSHSSIELKNSNAQTTSGAKASKALESVFKQFPELVFNNVVDKGETAVNVWLDFTGLPWLPKSIVSSVIRVSEQQVQIAGGLEVLITQQLDEEKYDGAGVAPTNFHINALILRAGYEAPNIHASIFTDDFIAHTPGKNPVAGDWHGAEEMAEHLHRILKLSNNTMSVETITPFSLANKDFGVQFSRATANRGNQRIDQFVCGIWRFKNGKIAEHWELVSDVNAWDDFWNGALPSKT